MEVENVYHANNEIQRQVDQKHHKWIKIYRRKWPLMRN
jgi:hypothetical protein